MNAFYLNECLKQIKFPNLLNTREPISEVPSNLSTMVSTVRPEMNVAGPEFLIHGQKQI